MHGLQLDYNGAAMERTMKRRAFLKGLAGLALVPFAPLLRSRGLPEPLYGGVWRRDQGEGYLAGGCTSLPHHDLAYNTGPAEWKHQHCVIYPNGKRKYISMTEHRSFPWRPGQVLIRWPS